jgi:NHLM bacteriocin system ABC transporter ATP-binding protein
MNSSTLPLGLESLHPELIVDQSVIPSTHRFIVSSENSIFLLEEGRIDLFSLSLEGQQSHLGEKLQHVAERFLSFPGHFFPGPLRFLASFKSGEWLFPFPLNSSDLSHCVLAVARGSCRVARLSLSELRQVLSRSPTLQRVALIQIQEWVKRLNLIDHGLILSEFPSILNPYERHHLAVGSTFMSFRSKEMGTEQEVFWLKVHEGTVCGWGLPVLSIQEGPLLYPFSSLEWFKCLQLSVVEFFPSHSEFLLNESLWAGLSLYQTHFLSLLTSIQANQSSKREDERVLRFQSDRSLLDHSIQELQTLLNPEPIASSGSDQDLLFQACQIVGNHLGLKFSWPKSMIGNQEERLQNLCMNSQIYFRRIRLFGRWWQTQALPIVAFYKEDDQPVAILPHSSQGYQLVDPAKRTLLTVTEEVASQISTVGYMFYRQLPTGHLTVRQLGRFNFWKRGREWLTFVFLALCSIVASLSFPLITKFLFDVVIPDRNKFLLLEVTLGAVMISLASLAFNYGREAMILRLSSLSDHDMEMAVWQRFINLPLSFFRRYSIYDLFTFTSAISSIRQLLTSHVIQVCLNACFAILYFFLMFYYSRILAVVGIVILIIEFLAILIPSIFGIRYGRQLLDRQIHANNKMLEMVQALTKVRLAGVEARMFHRWEQAYASMQQMNLKGLFLRLKAGVFNVFWVNTGTLILYLAVFFIVVSQSGKTSYSDLTLGGFMAFMSVYGLFSNALQQFGSALLDTLGIVPLWEKVNSFTKEEMEDFSMKAEPGSLQGQIRIDHLTFGYQPDQPPVLQDISMIVSPGECVAIIGPSGCGKSTLVRLLLGFESSDQGSIYYDNQDIKGLNLQTLRRQMGVVLQSGAIFDGTILDNINSGRHFSVEEIKEALDLSGASSFIQELPMGIQTVLTNAGVSLSGGQRQLILLARAVVGKPKILILDEATSSLDNRKQQVIHEHLSRLPMTRVIIAQRLTAVQHADRILVIEKGRIADQGSFSELANRPGFLSDLLAKQSIT